MFVWGGTAFVSHKQNLIKPSFIPLVQEDNTRMRGKTLRSKDSYKYCGRGKSLVLGNKDFVKGGARMYGAWMYRIFSHLIRNLFTVSES